MTGDLMNVIQQRTGQFAYLVGGERRVVMLLPRRGISPFAVRRQDCSEQVGVAVVVVEARRIGVTERLCNPKAYVPTAPIVVEPNIEQVGAYP